MANYQIKCRQCGAVSFMAPARKGRLGAAQVAEMAALQGWTTAAPSGFLCSDKCRAESARDITNAGPTLLHEHPPCVQFAQRREADA